MPRIFDAMNFTLVMAVVAIATVTFLVPQFLAEFARELATVRKGPAFAPTAGAASLS